MPREAYFFIGGIAFGWVGAVYFWLLWRVGKIRGELKLSIIDAQIRQFGGGRETGQAPEGWASVEECGCAGCRSIRAGRQAAGITRW
jgi:hypothetical protein